MSTSVFVGIDVAFAKNKMLPVAICEWDGMVPRLLRRRLFPKPPRGTGNKAALDGNVRLQFAESVSDWLKAICMANDLRIERVAIDAPSDYCRPDRRRRASETALDGCGISVFATPTEQQFLEKIEAARTHLNNGGAESEMPNANQIWMLIGFELFCILQPQYECIEVYPQAIVRSIGCEGKHKSEESGYAEQVEALSTLLGISRSNLNDEMNLMCFGGRHDKLDAFLSSWVACLPADCRKAYGEPPSDAIWIPDIKRLASIGAIRSLKREPNCLEMPIDCEPITLDRKFSIKQLVRLRLGGHGDMDSKWSFYFEDDWLSIYRGSGACWYRARISESSGGGRMEEAWMNRSVSREFGDQCPSEYLGKIFGWILNE